MKLREDMGAFSEEETSEGKMIIKRTLVIKEGMRETLFGIGGAHNAASGQAPMIV